MMDMSLSEYLAKLLTSPDLLAITLALSIPIVAIVVGGIQAIVKRAMEHRERMAMIEHGIHPDFPPEEEDLDVTSPGKGES